MCFAQHNDNQPALDERDGEAGLAIEEIAEGIFVAVGEIALVDRENRGHTANLGFIIGQEGVAVIDTGGSFMIGRRLLSAIRARTNLPIKYIINTHAHPDHMFGNAAFSNTGATFIAHEKFNTALAQRGPHYLSANLGLMGKEHFSGTGLIPAQIGVSGERILDLGNRKLTISAQPTAHTDNDVIVVDLRTNTAFLGDLLFVRHIPALDGSLLGWLKLMDQLSQQSFARVVPGHGPASAAWPQALEPQKRYLANLARELRAEIAKGTSINEASQIVGLAERDVWALFEEFNTRNATAGFAELEWE